MVNKEGAENKSALKKSQHWLEMSETLYFLQGKSKNKDLEI